MNAVLITGGEQPEYQYTQVFLKDKFVCVADSGLDWVVKSGVTPDLVVGDMDSVQDPEILKTINSDKIEKLPVDKDDTDTLYALKRLKVLGYKHITMIGGGGGRLDHLLGVVSLFETDVAPDIWITRHEVVYKSSSKLDLYEFVGCNISIYPLGKVNCSIKSFGLKWELDRVDWFHKSIGISNEVISSNAWIDCQGNRCLIITPIRGKGFE